MFKCGNNNELALQHGGFCGTWSLAAKGLLALCWLSLVRSILHLQITCAQLWELTPKLKKWLSFHSADQSSDGSLERFQQQIKVSSDGTNLWLAPIILLSSCKIYVKFFPFDEQHCELKFGSWTYDGFHLDLVEEAAEADLEKFAKNGEWELIGVPCERNLLKYICCDAPYPDITYTVKIRRRTLFFFFNMIIPCLVIVGKEIHATFNKRQEVSLPILTQLQHRLCWEIQIIWCQKCPIYSAPQGPVVSTVISVKCIVSVVVSVALFTLLLKDP